MQKNRPNIKLSSYDDIFSTDHENSSNEQIVRQIPLSELHPFKDHPFGVRDDEEMDKMVESINSYGVLTPAIARPRKEGGYEIIAGHRRCHASEKAGLETIPVIVRNLDDDAATILMVDSNLQREDILPSEKAKAFKMKMEAIKHQGSREDLKQANMEDLSQSDNGDLTSCQVGTKLRTDEAIAVNSQDSARNVQRFIRLTNLTPDLMQMVDDHKLAFNPAVEISYLKPDDQKLLIGAMEYAQATPSLSQAQRLKKFSQQGMLKYEVMCAVMTEEKKPAVSRITIEGDVLKKYFPKSYSPKEMENTIIKLLEQWQNKREHGEQSI